MSEDKKPYAPIMTLRECMDAEDVDVVSIIADLRATIAEKDKEIERLREEVNIVKISCNCCVSKTELADLCATIAETKEEIIKWKGARDHLSLKNTTLIYEKNKAEAELADLRADFNTRCRELAEIKFQRQTDALEGQAAIEEAYNRIVGLEAENSLLRKRLIGIEEVHKQWEKDVDLENTRMAGHFWSAICDAVEVFEPCDGCPVAPVECKGSKECHIAIDKINAFVEAK